MHLAFRHIWFVLFLVCADLAQAGYFVSSADEQNLNKSKTLQIKSSRRYKHLDWTYIDVAPQAEGALKKMALGAGVRLVPDGVVKLAQVPSDPLAPDQTHLYSGYPSGDIHAYQAWDILTTASVTVAIIDSGVEITHEDLAANIWDNQAEINGVAGVDDDNNGYIDDFHGWNTFNNSNDIVDTLGHGTRVAGVLGARGQNGIGIAGICWDVKMMPVRAFQNTTTTLSVIADAFDYILDNNSVRVINCSFGDDTFSQPIYDAIVAAGRKGILVVAAAGNSSRNIDTSPFYPASYNLPNVIAVGAVSMDGNLWVGSNFGNTVAVVAPGTSIFSSTIGNTYNSGNGTSYATPIVSGAAALIMTQWPYMPVDQVKLQINRTSRITNPLLSEQIGGGLLDMQAMLTRTVTAAHDWQLYR